MNIVMGFSCIGAEMERLILLVLCFLERKGAIRGAKRGLSSVIVLLYGKFCWAA